MKVAVLGGGFTGLSAAFYLQKKGYEVSLFERRSNLGGLAAGFKSSGWDWYLEYAYHHLFASDKDILGLAKDSGFNGIFFKKPRTESLYKISGSRDKARDGNASDYRIFPVDTPQDFLKFPLLPFQDKIRAAAVLAFLKFSPHLPVYESATSVDFFTRTMGKRAWEMLFAELLRKKFGKYAGNILASFMWARIKVRTKALGYVEGGFQAYVDYLEKVNKSNGVKILKNCLVENIQRKGDKYTVEYVGEGEAGRGDFGAVISTLPSPVLAKVAPTLFPPGYFDKYKKLKYLNAVVLIIESNDSILKKTYWLNICDSSMPLMLVGQHTNFMDKKNYAGHHIAYVGWYVDADSSLWKMSEQEIIKFIKPHIKKINPSFNFSKIKTYMFKEPFAQPVFDRDFVENKPSFETPLKNFYIANLDMTYPNDRGTNYAVKLGRQVAGKFL